MQCFHLQTKAPWVGLLPFAPSVSASFTSSGSASLSYGYSVCANATNPHDSQFNMKTDRNCLPPSSANHILKSKLKPRWSRALGYSIQSSEAQLEASSVSSVSAVASSLLLFASFSSLFHDVGCADAPLKTKTFIENPRIIWSYSVNHCYSKCWYRS